MRVLFVTSQWPTPARPDHSPFVKREVESLREVGVDVDVFHYRGGWSPLQYGRAGLELRGRVGNRQYDLIHVRFGQCGLVALAQRRLPIVVRFGGSDLLGWRNDNGREPLASKLLRATSRFVARRADEVIIVSDSMSRCLPPVDYHVIPAGIDLDLFTPSDPREARAQLGLPQDSKLVLFAADPEREIKRFDLAREALERLEPDGVELVVTSRVRPEQMPLYMSACDALLLTSEHEGSPNVVKEALACNLPVVSVDVGDVRERLAGLPDCVVCADRHADTIAAGLRQVLSSAQRPDLRGAVAHLEASRVAARVVEVYRTAIRRKAGGRSLGETGWRS